MKREDESAIDYLRRVVSNLNHETETLLEEARKLMRPRGADLAYIVARFVGIAHSHTPGNTSLGLWNAEEKDTVIGTLSGIEDHGDAGLFMVDVRTWEVTNRGGHAGESEWPEIHEGKVVLA